MTAAKTRSSNPTEEPRGRIVDLATDPEKRTASLDVPAGTDLESAPAETQSPVPDLDAAPEAEIRIEVTSSPPPAFTHAGGTGERVYARRGNGAWGYGPINSVDRGQVFELRNLPRDAFLLDTGYVERLPAGVTLYECPECGISFIDLGSRQGHVRRRHSEALRDPLEAEQRDLEATNRDERLIAATAPLYLPSAERPSASA